MSCHPSASHTPPWLTSWHSLTALLACSLAPVLFSMLHFLPLSRFLVRLVSCKVVDVLPRKQLLTLCSKFHAHVIDPPVFSSRHAVPAFFGLGIVSARGQAIFIFYNWVLNIILSAVNPVVLHRRGGGDGVGG